MKKRNYEMDMTQGPILKKMVTFCLPILLSNILQLLYNAADVMVVGRFAGQQALAAVGSTGSITNLITSVFIGLSIGVSVAVSQYFGAKQEKDVSETVHTAIAVSLLCGGILLVVGVVFSRTFLLWMDTPTDVIDLSTKYMSICFLGMPGLFLYNFASGILRAVGDTKRPLYFLTLSGLLNVVLNLFFVIVCGMDVDGVALATILSQYLSASLVLRSLIKSDGCYHYDWKKTRIVPQKLWTIARIGLPAGFQTAIFSISNVMIQSGINSFGSVTMAGNTAGGNLDSFVGMAMTAFSQGAVTFTGQNVGAKKPERLGKIFRTSICLVTAVGFLLGMGLYMLGEPLLSLYNSDPAVVAVGMVRLSILSVFYFTCGFQDVLSGMIRGMGYSVAPFVVSVMGICGIRIVWLLTVFERFHSLKILYLSYPITWVGTGAIYLIVYYVLKKKLTRKLIAERDALSGTES